MEPARKSLTLTAPRGTLYARSFRTGEPVTTTARTKTHGVVHLIKAVPHGPDTVVAYYGSHSTRYRERKSYV